MINIVLPKPVLMFLPTILAVLTTAYVDSKFIF